MQVYYFGVLSFMVQPRLPEVVEGPDTLNEHLVRLLAALVQTLHASVLSKSMVNVLSSLLQLCIPLNNGDPSVCCCCEVFNFRLPLQKLYNVVPQ